MAKLADNSNLARASKAKQDEFYTMLSDIEDEMRHYRKHFAGKTVLCNCDDPFESNFFKYFVLNFNRLKLKKLIATCYTTSPIAGKQLSLFDVVDDAQAGAPYKAIVTTVYDITGDGGIDMVDVAELFKQGENQLVELAGDGDFRSEECLALMDEADIVVTNPPFSLFRDYVAELVRRDKKFIIIGNKNAITYKEIFPLIKENRMWVGTMPMSREFYFHVPEDYAQWLVEQKRDRSIVKRNGELVARSASIWYTNLDHKKRHEELILVPRYDAERYPKYDNYDAIEVSKVQDIPYDYEPGYLVPVEYRERLEEAGFVLGSERKDSRGRLCVCVCGQALIAEDRGTGSGGVLQRPDGRADNLLGQVQSRPVRDRWGGEPRQRQRVRLVRPDGEWEAEIQTAIGAPCDAEWCSGVMGVPVSFMDKYNPRQFELVGCPDYREGPAGASELGIREIGDVWMSRYRAQGGRGHYSANMVSLVYYDGEGRACNTFKRILVRRKM